ncbi:MAG: SPOR domain-containing protein [Rhodoferax sp.]|uniref:SPOR domain-containing protein n=1 Tax=Rhodoferax sp. TaxID=50421 RepID=UPI001831848E|nr:SPOR domain-containing protein [Rhodoferax sp.]NMM14189.1 SPOR domain-containing protein [Rhodoferax sp.]
MLRFIVLALVLLNGLYFAWSQGFLRAYGFAPAQQSEPQRLGQQIRPDAVRLLTAQELSQSEAPRAAGKPTACLQAGLFDATQSAQLRRTLAVTLPAGSWTLEETLEPARWIVYMGKYANAEELAKKRAQLASLNLKFEPLTNPALGLGLSLGGFNTQAAATAALDAFSRRGVRTARVVQEREEVSGTLLRLPAADEALRARLDELKPVMAGKAWSPCR